MATETDGIQPLGCCCRLCDPPATHGNRNCADTDFSRLKPGPQRGEPRLRLVTDPIPGEMWLALSRRDASCKHQIRSNVALLCIGGILPPQYTHGFSAARCQRYTTLLVHGCLHSYIRQCHNRRTSLNLFQCSHSVAAKPEHTKSNV